MDDRASWRVCRINRCRPARNDVREQHGRCEKLIGRDAECDERIECRPTDCTTSVDEQEFLRDDRRAAGVASPPRTPAELLNRPDERHERVGRGAGLARGYVAQANLRREEGDGGLQRQSGGNGTRAWTGMRCPKRCLASMVRVRSIVALRPVWRYRSKNELLRGKRQCRRGVDDSSQHSFQQQRLTVPRP